MFKKIILPVVVAVALVGCGGGSSNSSSTSSQQTGSATSPLTAATINAHNFIYNPANIFVKKGSVVTFTNTDLAGHSLTADDGSFDTDIISKGGSATVTMNTVGTIKVHCKAHPSIQGSITVVQ